MSEIVLAVNVIIIMCVCVIIIVNLNSQKIQVRISLMFDDDIAHLALVVQLSSSGDRHVLCLPLYVSPH